MTHRPNEGFSLRKITRKDPELCKISALYREAFPRVERFPFWQLRRLSGRDGCELLVASEDGQFVGFCLMLCDGAAHYLCYLAVERERRGRGDGSKMLEALQQRYGEAGFFLALEPLDAQAENAAQRIKRYRFYERNGLRPLPLIIREGSCRFAAMGCGKSVCAAQYNQLMRRHFGRLYAKLLPFLAVDSW